MQPFKFFPKTADAKFQAYGKTLEEAFANAALAMFNVMTSTEKIKPIIERKISAEAESLEALLYDFLVKFLVLLDGEGFVAHEVIVSKVDETDGRYSISATALGDKLGPKYEAHDNVKAVTYNEMKIKSDKKGWVLQVVCDI
jgi:SHS2 domain-containing protein